MGRKIAAFFAGLISGIIMIAIIESVGHLIFPLPAGIDPQNMENLAVNMDKIPLGAKLFVLLAWAAGSFTGALIAALISKESKLPIGLGIGTLLMLFGIFNMIMLPHPLWFWIIGILIFLPSAWLGIKIINK